MTRLRVNAGLRTKMTRSERSALRREGSVLANLYGKNTVPRPIYLHGSAVQDVLDHGHGLIEIDLEGDGIYSAMIQQIDRHPVNRQILHVDLHSVDLTEAVEVEVPLILNGLEKVEKTGGVILQLVREINLRALPTEIPEYLMVDISEMEIGDTMTAGEVKLPAGCQLREDNELKLVSVVAPAPNTADAPEVPKEPEIVHNQEGR